MREVALHVPFEAIETMGFDSSPEGFQGVDVRDITVVSREGSANVATVTYSEPVDDALSDSDTVERWERIGQDGTDATYLCKTVVPDLPGRSPGNRERNLDVQAVTVEDDGCTVALVGSQEALECTGEFDAGDEFPVSLRRLTDYDGPRDDLDTLSARQREVLETAYELGYYEVPRATTADEIARQLGIGRSTVTEHLQRAERNLLSSILSG